MDTCVFCGRTLMANDQPCMECPGSIAYEEAGWTPELEADYRSHLAEFSFEQFLP